MTVLYWLPTETEHGRTEARLTAAAADYTGLPPEDGRLAAARENGRPFFRGYPGLYCSVTHSGGVWLCALSGSPVGVDLQQSENRDILKIAARFFRPEETEWLRRNPSRFFEVWCAKESYVKYTGEGLAGLDGFSVIRNGGLAAEVGGTALRLIPFQRGYTLCLCGGEGAPDLRRLEMN